MKAAWADLENRKKYSCIDKKKQKDGVTITVKLACYKDIVAASEYSKSFSENDQSTVVHSAVFTGHLVYACVVVALIFCNDNSLIMRREWTPISVILLPKHLSKHNPTLLIESLATEIVGTYKYLAGISEKQENNVYKNGDKIAIFDVFW